VCLTSLFLLKKIIIYRCYRIFVCQGHRLQFDLHKAYKIKHTLLNNSGLCLLYSTRYINMWVLAALFYTPIFSRLFALTPIANTYHILIYALSFSVFNALWLAALCYTNHYLLHFLSWEYHFTFMRFLFTPTSGIQLWRKTRAWCMRYQHERFYRLFEGTRNYILCP
jgi:hypothetical protein